MNNIESNGGIYNVGTSIPTDLNTVFNTFEIFNKTINTKYYDFRKGDVKHSYADISKILNKLGFKPQYDILRGLNEYIKYNKKLELERLILDIKEIQQSSKKYRKIKFVLAPFRANFKSKYTKKCLNTHMCIKNMMFFLIIFCINYGKSISDNPYAIFLQLTQNKEYKNFKHIWVASNQEQKKEFEKTLRKYKNVSVIIKKVMTTYKR
ncbi:hypothetical protein MTR07_12005 [Staphylococcus agnetis]|uniref:hypothetical protein n=1 Tax=Staphylococcus agnetis TaxID=985762 RepID=UPI0025AC7414|nr:hypothetical protein [Staphylococcus agnetis]MCO4351523.1 hypothetical protein [Staphylococcus agnetis]